MTKHTGITLPPFPNGHTHQLYLSCSHFKNSHRKQLPWSDQERAGYPQKVGLVVYNLCSYRYCILHWDLWALRNLCAAYNRHCRYSVHLKPARKQTILHPRRICTKITATNLWREEVSRHPSYQRVSSDGAGLWLGADNALLHPTPSGIPELAAPLFAGKVPPPQTRDLPLGQCSP